MMSGPRFGANCNGGGSGVTGRDLGRDLCVSCAAKNSLIPLLLSALSSLAAVLMRSGKRGTKQIGKREERGQQ